MLSLCGVCVCVILSSLRLHGKRDSPATVQTPVVDLGPRPQAMAASVTLAMGELSCTVRTQVPAWSSEPTQNSCHVAWAETAEAPARRKRANFMAMSEYLS